MSSADNTALGQRIARLSERVESDPNAFGVLSTGERIAVAFVLNRPDLLKQDGWTMLKALDRLGPEWTAAAFSAHVER